ncbi:hypothetical protein JRI60_14185 [Archangium violaceum]|uniref:MYXO-CTERM sorting domain-containing protein n=1 Tax=Archangium violaceum TaxID=83451 RepID=UPI00194F9B31|nr:MYXO-CTERM sorting domain-containing protein [Archangium violaceum]QRO00077.1 hypothetical protein JRI60_14185 [Archangium violaceum]
MSSLLGACLQPRSRLEGSRQQQTLLETQWGTPNLEGEANPNTQFLHGALGSSRPEWFLPELSVRAGGLFSRSVNLGASSNEGQVRDVLVPVVMAADVRAAVVAGAFRAMASLGVAPRRAFAASLTPVGDIDGPKLISREHWLGATLLDDALFIRAGRLTLPFGIRSVEHTLWARAVTRTDSNDSQQHGVAVAPPIHYGFGCTAASAPSTFALLGATVVVLQSRRRSRR